MSKHSGIITLRNFWYCLRLKVSGPDGARSEISTLQAVLDKLPKTNPVRMEIRGTAYNPKKDPYNVDFFFESPQGRMHAFNRLALTYSPYEMRYTYLVREQGSATEYLSFEETGDFIAYRDAFNAYMQNGGHFVEPKYHQGSTAERAQQIKAVELIPTVAQTETLKRIECNFEFTGFKVLSDKTISDTELANKMLDEYHTGGPIEFTKGKHRDLTTLTMSVGSGLRETYIRRKDSKYETLFVPIRPSTDRIELARKWDARGALSTSEAKFVAQVKAECAAWDDYINRPRGITATITDDSSLGNIPQSIAAYAADLDERFTKHEEQEPTDTAIKLNAKLNEMRQQQDQRKFNHDVMMTLWSPHDREMYILSLQKGKK